MRNYLCLSIDGLQSGMIGAYGNTWIQTPTLDSLACQSALFERYYASTIDLTDAMRELWSPNCGYGSSPLLSPDYHKILLTDDDSVFTHEKACIFDEKQRIEPKHRKRPAIKIEGTQLYHNIATLADLLRNRSSTPFIFWAHFNAFRHGSVWDFPMDYRERYQIDDDPAPYPGVAVPDVKWNKHSDPDIRQAIAEAYSGGVAVLDDTLAGLLEFLQEEGLDRNTVLVFMSVRGFSLGEHGYIGANADLYGENVHLALMIRFHDAANAGFRSHTLLQPRDIWHLMSTEELPDKPDDMHTSINIGNDAIVNPDWLAYRRSFGTELYVKPDDRWEANDVADRCSHAIEELFGSNDDNQHPQSSSANG